MFKKIMVSVLVYSLLFLAGCASVPMGTKEEDTAFKKFMSPSNGNAGLYIYRDTLAGQALKKTVSLDGVLVGETANKVYFYKEITPGKHTLSTESEFGDNTLSFEAEAGKNYFVEQYIKLGVFVGGSDLKLVDEATGQQEVRLCSLAK